MPGPWDKYRTPAPAPQGGGVIIGRANPYTAQIEKERLDKARADNAVTPYDKRKAAADATKAEADARNAPAIRAADARLKQAQADALERANREADAGLDPATTTYYAQQVLAGAPMPAIGMGKQAAANRQAIMQEVARLGGAAGLNGADAAAQIAHYKAGTKQISNLENMAGTIGVNEQTALANGQQYIDRSAELPFQSPITPVNMLSNAIQRLFGGETISKADAAHNTFVNEYAKVVAGSPSGAGVLSDSARREAMSTINSNGSVAQKQAAFEQMKADMANRMIAIHGGINNAYRALTKQPGYEVPASTNGLTVAAAPGNRDSMPGANTQSPLVGDTTGSLTASTAQYLNQDDPKVEKQVAQMIRAGKSAAEINSVLQPLGYPGVDPASVSKAQEVLRANPGYKGPLVSVKHYVEQGANTRAGNEIGLSTLGSAGIGAYDGLNSLTFGKMGDAADYLSGKPGQSELAAHAAGEVHPIAKGVGQLIGTLPAFVGAEAGLAGLAARGVGGSRVAALLAKPVTSDLVGGAYAGAGGSPDNRVAGALFGSIAGAGGGTIGRNVVSPVAAALARTSAGKAVTGVANEVGNAGRRALNIPEVAPTVAPPKPSVAEALIMKKAGSAGVDGIAAQLAEAQRLGVPMALADTHPALTSLTGAAVRRSPDAAATAESALLPRARGQIDRFGNAVERDLGPIGNIPQISADMTAQARTAAGPLYDSAYANAVPGTPELAGTLNTPFGRQALGRAQTIAANERRAPSELGFAQDSEGNTILNPQPNQQIADHLAARAELDDAQNAYRMARNGSGDMGQAQQRVVMARDALRRAEGGLSGAPDPTAAASIPNYTTQTLDYVKRGMDDVLEQHRNPITGRLVLDEAGRAQNQVRQQFLSEVDSHNPAYAEARNAYAGPVQARDAMARGQDAYSLHPNELAMQVGNQTDEHLAQMQLGYRDTLMARANSARFNANPFDATLGTPAAEQRLAALHPDMPSIADLLRQRDLEGQLARAHNKILGNSDTAARTIADQEFANPVAEGALHAGAAVMTHGASIPGTAARIAGVGLRDRIAMGVGEGATQKANRIAELLLNPDPAASAATLSDLANASQLYKDYIRANNTRLGASLGAVGGGWVASGGAPN
ncbi:hypothetical protein GCM10008023_19730 [Sphingomonas glacialis]|uniref:Uncharacterized protein n=1 Tax=Sphingomonas glacialis TaxID=658225 RepID=A0ABQ3LI49_9SPHN|nr:hypothetical protein [Sphingomonas glacialis]GHH16104.1 hypothetical protein GCM10008023_19730 [Sphingomonas glacialis]